MVLKIKKSRKKIKKGKKSGSKEPDFL